MLRAQSGSLTEFYRTGYAFDGTPIGSSAVFGATNGRFELRVAAPIAAFDGVTRLNAIGRPVILVLTRTDGTRVALSSLLTSARNSATPILFDPTNRTQTAASPTPGNLAPNAVDFTFDTNNVLAQSHWEGWNSLANNRNSGVANAANRPILMQGVNSANIQPLNLTFAGPLQATLHVSTSGTDADWVIKLIDVYAGDFPDPKPNPAYVAMGGYQQLVRGDVFRGKFRNSFEKPEPFKPGEVAKIEFEIPDICHTFRRGHRVMIHVQSTWFPLVDRNPQTFVNIPTAKPEDFQKATHRLHRGGKAASSLTVQMLPAGAK